MAEQTTPVQVGRPRRANVKKINYAESTTPKLQSLEKQKTKKKEMIKTDVEKNNVDNSNATGSTYLFALVFVTFINN